MAQEENQQTTEAAKAAKEIKKKAKEGYLQSFSLYFETFRCFTKFFFRSKRNDAQLLLINMVYTSCLTSCRTT